MALLKISIMIVDFMMLYIFPSKFAWLTYVCFIYREKALRKGEVYENRGLQ
jgi:hypothetical protein